MQTVNIWIPSSRHVPPIRGQTLHIGGSIPPPGIEGMGEITIKCDCGKEYKIRVANYNKNKQATIRFCRKCNPNLCRTLKQTQNIKQ